MYGVHRARLDGSSFTRHQPCQRWKYITSVNIPQWAIKLKEKDKVGHVESHASAVSLLESGERALNKSEQQQQHTNAPIHTNASIHTHAPAPFRSGHFCSSAQSPSSVWSIVCLVHRLFGPSSVWSIVCLVHRLSGPSSVWSIVCLAGPSSVWSIVCLVHRLSGWSIVCLAHRLSGPSSVWSIVCLTHRLSGSSSVWSIVCLTKHFFASGEPAQCLTASMHSPCPPNQLNQIGLRIRLLRHFASGLVTHISASLYL